MSEQYRTDADMSTLKVNAEWSNYNPGDAIEGEIGYYYGINAFSTVQDAADAVSASATPEQTVSIADAAYGVTRFTKSAILSGTATFDLTDAEPFMLYTDGVNAAEYEISAGTVVKTSSLSLRAEDADKNHQDGLTVSVNCLGTVDMSGTDGGRNIWVRKNTELTIGETGLVTGVTQISNRGIINLNGTINADSISGNGQLMLAGLEDTDGVMNINGGELNVTGVRTIAAGSAISIAVKDNTTGKGVVNLTNGGRITAAGSEMNIGAMGALSISDASSVTAARIQNSGVINLTGSATLDTDVELTDSGKVVFGSQTAAFSGSFAGKIEDKSTEYLTQVQVLNGSLVLESGAEINISKKYFKDIKNGFTLGTTDRNEDDGTRTATVTVEKGASILSPNYFWIGSADGAYERPEEQSGRFKLIVDGGTVDASHNAFTVRNTGAVEIRNGGSLTAYDGVIRNTVTVAGEGSSFTFGGNVYGESPSGAANAPAYGTASITVSEKASASFTKLQIGGDGLLRAKRRGELIIINATATAETITITAANKNEEARGLISLTKNASLTVTSALVNNGRITLDHTSTLEFAEITNNGTITVDMTGYKNEFSLLMNYTGSASVDYAALIGNWADIGENYTVINNMLFLGEADMSTLKINADWSGFKFGDKVGDGYYYGINAFSDFHTAVNSLAKETANIEFSGNTMLDEAGETIFLNSDHDLTIMSDSLVSIGNCANWGFAISNKEGTTVTINSDMDLGAGPLGIYTFGCDPGFGQSYCNVVINAELVGKQVWAARDANVTISETGSLSSARGEWVQRNNSSITANGNGDGTTIQLNASWINFYGGKLALNNTCMTSGKVAFNDYKNDTVDESVSSVTLSLNNSNFKSTGNLEINKSASTGLLELTDNSTFTAVNVLLNNTNAVIELTNSTLAVDKAVTNSGTITIDGSTLSAGTVTNNGTINVSGAVDLSGIFTGSAISLSDKTQLASANGFTHEAALTTANLTEIGAGSYQFSTLEFKSQDETGFAVAITAGAVVNVSTLLNIDRRVDGEILPEVKGILTVEDGAAVTVGTEAEKGTMYNKRGSVTVIEKGGELSVYGEMQNTGFLTVEGVLNLFSVNGLGESIAGRKNGESLDENMTGDLLITNGGVLNYSDTENSKGWIGVGAKIHNAGWEDLLVASQATISNGGSMKISVGENAYEFSFSVGSLATLTLDGSESSVKVDAAGAGVRNAGTIDMKTNSLFIAKNIANSGTISMDATSSITANSITGTGAIAITIDAASLTADRYDLITLTGTGALDTANITVNGNAFSSGTKYGEYTILKDDNDIFLTRQDQTTLYVNSAYTPDNADGHIYGYNAFSNAAAAFDGLAANTESVELIGDNLLKTDLDGQEAENRNFNVKVTDDFVLKASEGGSTLTLTTVESKWINGGSTNRVGELAFLSASDDKRSLITIEAGVTINSNAKIWFGRAAVADESEPDEIHATDVVVNGDIILEAHPYKDSSVYGILQLQVDKGSTLLLNGSMSVPWSITIKGAEFTVSSTGELKKSSPDSVVGVYERDGVAGKFIVNGSKKVNLAGLLIDANASAELINGAETSFDSVDVQAGGVLELSSSSLLVSGNITNGGSFIVSGASTLKGTVTGGLTAQDAAFSEESAFTADRMTVNGTVSFHAADYNGMSVAKGTGGELKVLGISETAALSLSSIEVDSLDLAISVAKGKETGYITLTGDLTVSALNFTIGSMNLDSDKTYTLVSAANLAAANITVNGASLLEQDGKKLFSADGKLYELTQTAADVSVKFYKELPIPAIKDTSVTQQNDTVNYQYSISVTAEPGTADTFYRWALTRDELAAADYVGADTVLDLGGNTVQGFYYQVKAVNEYGGEAESIAVYVAVKDITAPVINSLSFAQGEGYAFTITADATDNFGGAVFFEYRYADNAEMNNAVTISGNTFMLTPADAGKTYYVEVRAKDAAGNSTEWTKAVSSQTVNDVTAPVVASDGIEQSAGGYSYTVKATATDNLDTNPKIYYRWATSVEGLESAESYDISAALETADTVQTFFYQIMSEDASGNKSAWSDVFTVKATDCTAPVFSAAPTLAQGDNYTFTVTAEATDNFGGEIVYEFRYADNAEMNGATVTSDSVFKLNPENAGETCYVEVRAKDAAGNWSAWTKAVPSWTVNDVTAPVVASNGIEQSAGGYSYTVKATATDNLDTNPKIYYRWATSVEGLESAESYDISAALETADTVQSFFYQIMSEDASGNKSAWSDVFTVKAIDCTAPVFSAAPSFAQGEGYLFTVTAEATDNFGGEIVYEFRYADNAEMNGAVTTYDAAFTLTPSDAGKTYYVEVRAKDAAGNWSAWTKAAEQAVNDVTAPVLIPGYIAQTVGDYTYTIYASATDNLDANPKIYYRWAETLDGLDGADVRELSAVLETANTVQSFFYQIMSEDASGNRTEWSGAYRVDAVDYTAPVFSALPAVTQMENAYAFTITAAAADNFGGEITYEYRYADNSGMENATVISTPYFLLDENKVGDWYVQVRATDAAGNRSEWTSPVSVFQCADVTAPLLTSWRIDQTAHTYSFTVTATGLDNATAPKDLEFFYRYAATPEELSGDGTGIADALVFTADDAGKNYYYQVRVKDAAGNFSEWSAASLFTVANNAGGDISNPIDLTPNKVVDPKANIGTTESGYIVVNQEVPKSIFSLDNEIASRTTITLSGLTANDKISVTFLDENGKKLKKATATVKKNGEAVISGILTEAGTNFISLESASKKTDAVVSMEIINLYFDKPSDNNDLFSAAPLEQRVLEPAENDATRLLSDVSGWVGFGDPKDTFVFTSEYSRLLNLQLNEVETKVKITISNADGKKIKSYTVSEKTKNFEKEILLGSGAYYITVESGDKGKGKKNGNFSISALETVFDKATGDTPLKPAVMDLNNPNTGWVGYSDAADYYKFEVASTQSFGFNLTGLENEYTAGKQIKLHLIDMATGKKITLSGVKNNEDMNFATRKDLAAGSYCAVVSTGNEKKYMSNYSLSIASL